MPDHKDPIFREAEEEQQDMELAPDTLVQEQEPTDQQSVELQTDSILLTSVPDTTNPDPWDLTTEQEQADPAVLEWEQVQPTLDQSTKQEDLLPTYRVLLEPQVQVATNNPAAAATLNSTKEEAMETTHLKDND